VVRVRARVCKHRPAQRQAKGKRENRYVIKVMRLNREGGEGEVVVIHIGSLPYSVGIHS
jgi:hypothetical protein